MKLRQFFSEGRHVEPTLWVIMLACAAVWLIETIGPRHVIVFKDGIPPKVWIERAK
ncbi:hypothetical protein [Caulobacter vibrioides]|uniref:hypothetical protein n=1 Tax=Caulobacter vibrioides TaxID=155892 RepID=UPI0015E778D3|nr:hypothetical protein [Caulobacter vibrioides]